MLQDVTGTRQLKNTRGKKGECVPRSSDGYKHRERTHVVVFRGSKEPSGLSHTVRVKAHNADRAFFIVRDWFDGSIRRVSSKPLKR